MPILSVEGAKLDSLCYMVGADIFGSVEVCDRARDADGSVVSSGRESEAFVRGFKELVGIAFELTIFAKICGIELGVAKNFALARHAILRDRAGFNNALAYF